MSHDETPEKFQALLFSEQLCIWSVRTWVAAFKDGGNCIDVLAGAYERVDAQGAHAALDGMLSVIVAGARLAINIRCRSCTDVSPDEARILSAVAAWQDTGIYIDADIILSAFLTPSGVRAARMPFHGYAAICGHAGLRFQRKPQNARMIVELESAATKANQSIVLH